MSHNLQILIPEHLCFLGIYFRYILHLKITYFINSQMFRRCVIVWVCAIHHVTFKSYP